MMVGEESGRSFNGSGSLVDTRSSSNRSSWTFTSYVGREDCWNETTVRYPIGTNDSTLDGVGSQDCNSPLNSEHTGGIQVLLGDGTVRFVSENIDYGLPENLASRADGAVLGEF